MIVCPCVEVNYVLETATAAILMLPACMAGGDIFDFGPDNLRKTIFFNAVFDRSLSMC